MIKFYLTVLNTILVFNIREIKDMVRRMMKRVKMMMKKNKKIKRKRNHQKKKKNLNQKERVIKELQVKNLNAKTNELINVI